MVWIRVHATQVANVKEITDRLEFISGQIAEFVRREPYSSPVGFQLDANGDGMQDLFQCPEACTFRLHRIIVQSENHGPENPYAVPGAWIGVYRNEFKPDNLIDFIEAGATILPALFTADTDEAHVLRGNEVVMIRIDGGPASERVIARVQGVLHILHTAAGPTIER
jgi:hypothetical protein